MAAWKIKIKIKIRTLRSFVRAILIFGQEISWEMAAWKIKMKMRTLRSFVRGE
jgi:hypothetical protein